MDCLAIRRFNSEEQERLALNPNVLKVSEKFITYKSEFKIRAVHQNLTEGKSSSQIFVEAGFDLEVIGRENPKCCLERWKKVFNKRGEDGLKCDRRGKSATDRPLE